MNNYELCIINHPGEHIVEITTKAHRGRIAIRTFKITADALALRGYYKPSGRSGQTLEESLRMLSPEIYGTMNDPRIIELKGLEYVIDRLPKGIEECNRIILNYFVFIYMSIINLNSTEHRPVVFWGK